jgi:hypothetical protein
MSEIRLRAMTRIGELSRELEKAKPDKGHGAGLPTIGKTKEEQLEAAGISTSAAQRYRELVSPSEELVPVVTAAMENYFDEQAANQEVPTVRDLRGATVNGQRAKLKETPLSLIIAREEAAKQYQDPCSAYPGRKSVVCTQIPLQIQEPSTERNHFEINRALNERFICNPGQLMRNWFS